MSDHEHHDADGVTAVRREEELRVDREVRETGNARLRKVVESEVVDALVPRSIEHADIDRRPATEDDSGEIEQLPDGSVSIPVFEERLVIERRMVVRERIVITKQVVTEQQRVEAELRRERVELDVDEDAAGAVTVQGPHVQVDDDEV